MSWLSENETIEDFCLFCPVCDWAVHKLEIELMAVDLECPGCGTRNFSEFGPLIDREKDPADWWKETSV